MTYFSHETAIIDKNVKIDNGTKIWHWTHVSSNSTIGNNCIIGQNCFIGENVIIGNNVKIQNNVSVYDGVIIEDDVFCGPSIVFTNVLNPRSNINRKNEFQKTLVKKGASIGANSTIVCGTTVGKYSFIGASSLITKNVKDFELTYGSPAKQIGWVSKCGNKLDLPLLSSSKEETTFNGLTYSLTDGNLICDE